MIVGYSAVCALQGIKLEELRIETEGDIDLRGFLGIGFLGKAWLRQLALYRPHQGRCDRGAIRKSSRDRQGDFAQQIQSWRPRSLSKANSWSRANQRGVAGYQPTRRLNCNPSINIYFTIQKKIHERITH